MKKFFVFAMMFAAAAGAFVSCTKDVDIAVSEPSFKLSGLTKTVTLSAAVAETRTMLDSDHNLQWSEGDTFGVFCVADDGNTILDYLQAGAKATTLEMPEETKYLCCIYPYSSAYDVDYSADGSEESDDDGDGTPLPTLDKIAVSLPNTGTIGAAFNKNLPMAAKGEAPETDGEVHVVFSPLVAIVELNVYSTDTTEDKLGQITVSAGDTNCAGTTAYVDFTQETPALTNLTVSEFVVAATHDDIPSAKNSGAKCYLYLAPNTYDNFTVTVYTEQEEAKAKKYAFSYTSLDLENYFGQTLHLNLSNENVATDDDAVTMLWDFSNGDWSALTSDKGEKDGLNTVLSSGSITAKDGYLQVSSGGADGNQQHFWFNAPVSGKLKIVVSGTGGVRTDNRTVNVSVNGATPSSNVCIVDQNTKVALEYDITVYGETPVWIYSSQGHRIYSIEYTYETIKPSEWIFSSDAWSDVRSELSEQKDNYTATVDGLTLSTSGKGVKANNANIQMAGSGSHTECVFSFVATSPGDLYVTTSNTSSDKTDERHVQVDVGNNKGEPQLATDATKGDTQVRNGFKIENLTGETTVYIYSPDNALKYYSITYSGSVKKSVSEE